MMEARVDNIDPGRVAAIRAEVARIWATARKFDMQSLMTELHEDIGQARFAVLMKDAEIIESEARSNHFDKLRRDSLELFGRVAQVVGDANPETTITAWQAGYAIASIVLGGATADVGANGDAIRRQHHFPAVPAHTSGIPSSSPDPQSAPSAPDTP